MAEPDHSSDAPGRGGLSSWLRLLGLGLGGWLVLTHLAAAALGPRVLATLAYPVWSAVFVRGILHVYCYRGAFTRLLKNLVAAEMGGAVVAAVLSAAVIPTTDGYALWAWFWGLSVALIILSSAISRATAKIDDPRDPGKPLGRGGDIVCSWPWVQELMLVLRGARRHPAVKAVVKAVSPITPRAEISQLTWLVVLLLIFLGSASAQSVTVPHTPWGNDSKKAQPESAESPGTNPPAPAPPSEPARPPAADPYPLTGNSYAEQCPNGVDPGEPAPSPAREHLRSLWLGGQGIDGAGAAEAGCAGPARQVPGQSYTWYATGSCMGEIRSLGVAEPDQPPALLLQQAARVALDHAQSGNLLGASARTPIDAGDFQIIRTRAGNQLLIRRLASSGPGPPGDPRSCRDLDNQNVAYAAMPPSAVQLWLDLVRETEWSWPAPDGPDGSRFNLISDRTNAEVASIDCPTQQRCTLTAPGITRNSEAAYRVSVDQVLEHSP